MLIEQLPLLIEGILTFLSESLPILLEQGAQIILMLVNGIINAIPILVEQLPIIITSIVEFISGNLPAILETGVNVLIQLAAGIIQAIPQLVAQLPQIISAIVNGIGALIGSIVEVGKNIVRGIWDGITAMAGWIKDKVTGFFSGIVDGVKGFLGIHSPSRVFAGIGNNMAAGLGQGFENTMGGRDKRHRERHPDQVRYARNQRSRKRRFQGEPDCRRCSRSCGGRRHIFCHAGGG